MKPFDPKNRKGASGDLPRRKEHSGDYFNREDSRSSSHKDHATSPFARDKRPRINRSGKPGQEGSGHSDERQQGGERRSFNPNFSKENRNTTERSAREFSKTSTPYNKERSGREESPRRNESRPWNQTDRPRQQESRPWKKEERPARTDSPRSWNKEGHSGRSNNDSPRPWKKEERPARTNSPRPWSKEDRPTRTDSPRPWNKEGERGKSDSPRPWNREDRPAGGRRSSGYGGDSAGRDNHSRYPRTGERSDRREGVPKRWNPKKNDPNNYPRYDVPKPLGAVRLNRFIANSGICSRREADDLILAGVVSINGAIITELGSKVNPDDEVRFNGEVIKGEKKVYILMNKPKGFVTSVEDPHSDKTVMDLIKGACSERVYPVGRLDKNTVGVLLFTNDGELTRKLTHPSYNKQKIYQVTLDKALLETDMSKIAEGVTLEDGLIFADEISYVHDNRKEIGVEIHSGRNRIVRRIFESLGYSVQKLDRVYFAGLTKKRLKRGAWRFLTPQEVSMLKSGEYE